MQSASPAVERKMVFAYVQVMSANNFGALRDVATERVRVADLREAWDAARRVPGWDGNIVAIAPLSGGITNRNYVVRLNEPRGAVRRLDSFQALVPDTYVLRLCGKDTALLGIDRHVELAAATRAAELGFAPPVEGFLEPEGYLVTGFVEASPVPDLSVDDVMAQVGSILRRTHSGPKLASDFDCFGIAARYEKTAEKRKVSAPVELVRAQMVSAQIASAFSAHPEALVPAHNDLLNANFMRDRAGRVWLIDWEYAGMNSRWFDLGNLATNHELDGWGRDALLQAYAGSVTPGGRARITLMMVMSDLREAMWGVVQQAISTLEVNYVEYAGRHFERLLTNASTPEFTQALADTRAFPPPSIST
jgi:thiamine kinase-like enzyme